MNNDVNGLSPHSILELQLLILIAISCLVHSEVIRIHCHWTTRYWIHRSYLRLFKAVERQYVSPGNTS